jgi:hypothetical protein
MQVSKMGRLKPNWHCVGQPIMQDGGNAIVPGQKFLPKFDSVDVDAMQPGDLYNLVNHVLNRKNPGATDRAIRVFQRDVVVFSADESLVAKTLPTAVGS